MGMYDNMGGSQGGVDPQLIALLTALAQKQQQQRGGMPMAQRPQFNAMPQPQQRAPINVAPQGFGPGMTRAPQGFMPSLQQQMQMPGSGAQLMQNNPAMGQMVKPYLGQMTPDQVMQLIGGQ